VSTPQEPPQTRAALKAWIRERLRLPPRLEEELLDGIDAVFTRQERLWQESKHDAIHALSSGFAHKLAGLKTELSARDATVSSIARYFESLVADLTEKARLDPKTKLMNFSRFVEQLESFLALDQRGRWSAVGLVDVTGFKAYNDTLGHDAGDRIIARVAGLLSEHVRSDDLIAQERRGRPRDARRALDLHARFGGDEFCFLIPDLSDAEQAAAIGERFRAAVERFDWHIEDSRLVDPVRVDVGVVCLLLGPLAERRGLARRIATELVQKADQLMYRAKGDRVNRVHLARVIVRDRALVEIAEGVLHSQG
jgi:diguanylate cyclase